MSRHCRVQPLQVADHLRRLQLRRRLLHLGFQLEHRREHSQCMLEGGQVGLLLAPLPQVAKPQPPRRREAPLLSRRLAEKDSEQRRLPGAVRPD